jgi:hypothetical protein
MGTATFNSPSTPRRRAAGRELPPSPRRGLVSLGGLETNLNYSSVIVMFPSVEDRKASANFLPFSLFAM